MEKNLLVSVIQIVYPGTNKENFIKSYNSVLTQDYDNFEYIIVGEKNEDEVLGINKQDKRISFININNIVINKESSVKEFHSESTVSRSVKKNYGAKIAKGEFIYFIDDDFFLSGKSLIKEAINKAGMGYSMIAVHNTSDPSISIWSKVRKFDRDFYKFDEGNISCRFIKKELFQKVNGFNTCLIAAEDYDLHNRMLKKGGKIGFIDIEEIHLGEPKTYGDVLKLHYYYGKTMAEFKTSGGVLTFNNISPIRGAYLKNLKRFIQHPFMTVVFIFYQISRFIAGAIGGWKIIPWMIKTTIFKKKS